MLNGEHATREINIAPAKRQQLTLTDTELLPRTRPRARDGAVLERGQDRPGVFWRDRLWHECRAISLRHLGQASHVAGQVEIELSRSQCSGQRRTNVLDRGSSESPLASKRASSCCSVPDLG